MEPIPASIPASIPVSIPASIPVSIPAHQKYLYKKKYNNTI